ncbi:hypothetical protein GVAV_000235 [Gurleya vavrai]
MLIKTIPDTNILINHHKSLTKYFTLKNPKIQLYISRTVLVELDSLKNIDVNARHAVDLLRKNYNTKYVRLEGHGGSQMDIDTENDEISIENNDDKILRFAYDHRDFILMTGDRIMGLKAISYGLRCVVDEGNGFDRLLENLKVVAGVDLKEMNDIEMIEFNNETRKELFKEFKHDSEPFRIIKNENMEIEENVDKNEYIEIDKKIEFCNKENFNHITYTNDDEYLQEIINKVHVMILPLVVNIANYFNIVDREFIGINNNLGETIDFVLENFIYYINYLPDKSKDDLRYIKMDIEIKDVKKVKGSLRRLLVIFGYAQYTL